MTSAVIQGVNLSLSFGSPRIFHNLNVVIEPGEAFVLVGPSGQGKSSLLKMMAGLLKPTRGQILIRGQDFYAMTEEEKHPLLLKMGMLFQKNALFDSMTVEENVLFPLREGSGESDVECQQRVSHYLEAVGLSASKTLYPSEISGGMQKRLGIARALALHPEIIFYDDPTAGLDPMTSRKIVDLIISMQKEYGSTVVAVTNEMARAYQLADRIAFLFEGELLITGSHEQTLRNQDPRVFQFVRGLTEGPLLGLK